MRDAPENDLLLLAENRAKLEASKRAGLQWAAHARAAKTQAAMQQGETKLLLGNDRIEYERNRWRLVARWAQQEFKLALALSDSAYAFTPDDSTNPIVPIGVDAATLKRIANRELEALRVEGLIRKAQRILRLRRKAGLD